MGMSQMCTGAADYLRTSKPHSEKLCNQREYPPIRAFSLMKAAATTAFTYKNQTS